MLKFRTLGVLSIALAAWLCPPTSSAATDGQERTIIGDNVLRILQATDDPIVDAETNKVLYGVLLKEGTEESFSKSFLPDEKHPNWHKGEVVNLVQDFERRYRISIKSMTSWIQPSFSAYLSPEDLKIIQGDPRIESAEPIQRMQDSQSFNDTNAVWSDTAPLSQGASPFSKVYTLTAEMKSWGKQATSPNVTTNSTSNTIVYLIGGMGVGLHEDLDSVIQRVNINDVAGLNCGSRTGLTACTATQLKQLIGCNTHATAVAGVIGAKANGKGIVGVNPGVKMVSITVRPPTTGPCVPTGITSTDGIVSALDWIYQDIVNNNTTGKPSVIEMSTNADGLGSATYFNNAVTRTIRPAPGYVGAVFVQSAGNQFRDACNYAYPAITTGGGAIIDDGAIVVGAINNHGQPVIPLNNAPGFWKQANQGPTEWFGHEPGSNFGRCVDMWAPGDAIITTVGPLQSQGTSTYNTYAFLSGTSFSAPHVAGLASYLIEHRNLTTPAAVEGALRGSDILFPLGSAEAVYGTGGAPRRPGPIGRPISIPTLSPLPASVPHNTVYAEFIISKRCIVSPASPHRLDCGTGAGGFIGPTGTYPYTPFDATGGLLPGMIPNWGKLTRTSSETLWMNFDSYGTGDYSCSIYLTSAVGSGLITTSVSNTTTAPYYWASFPGPSTLPGQQFTSSCSSARAIID